MSCTICPCTGSLLNTGTPKNQRLIKTGVKLVLVPLVADDGTRNEVLSTDTLDTAFFDGKFQNEDPSKRWYPLGEFRNVTNERADPITESFSDGSSAIVQQGIRTYQGWLIDYAPVYSSKIDSIACSDFGVYVLDECGDFYGSYCAGTVDSLRPIKVNKDSVEARAILQSDTLKAKVQLTFEFSQLEKDSSLRLIKGSELGTGVDLLSYDGFIDANVDYVTTPPTTTLITAVVTQRYDDVFVDTTVTGLTVADFVIYNLTTAAAVVPSGVVEAPVGTYAVTIPAQTSADKLRVRVVSSDFFNESTITIS